MQSRPPPSAARSWSSSTARLRDCARCPLSATRTNVVFGAGNADADLMFVGEAPGQQEDLQGLPFVGRAGKLLDELLVEVGLRRDDVFVANVLKCRPPATATPSPRRSRPAGPTWSRQIELIEPRVICTLGQLRHQAPHPLARRHHAVRGKPQVHELGGRTAAGLPDLPSGGRPAHAAGEGGAARGLRRPARHCWRSRRRCRWERWARRPAEAGAAPSRSWTCSARTPGCASRPTAPRRPRPPAPRWPRGCGPATWCS